MAYRYTIETYRDRAKAVRWRLRHRNGHVVADSGEGYSSEAKALRSLGRLLDAPREAFRLASLAELARRAAKVAPAAALVLALAGCSTLQQVGDAQASPAVQGAISFGSREACFAYAQRQPAAASTTRGYLLSTASAALGCAAGIEAGLTPTPAPTATTGE